MSKKIVVIGGGAAGMMAAISAAEKGGQVTLLEPNERLGKKLNITGKGRCNVTNNCSMEELMVNIPCNGKFLYSAFSRFNSQDTMAFFEALGNKKGICRYGDTTLAMDESLILTAVDISGRAYLGYALKIPTQKVGTFDTELTEEFFLGFVRNSHMTLHLRQLAGTNSHHIIEGTFKSVARSLRKAVAIDTAFADDVPSTKGVL